MKFKVYHAVDGDWRWRLIARNGRIVADSSEGYKNKSDCMRILKTALRAKIVVVTEL